MYWTGKATLIKVETLPDTEGYKETRETRREVYVNKKSVARSEFYSAQNAGTKIVLTLEVHGVDYKGETLLEFEGKRYEVKRPYTRGGEIYELNCEEAKEPKKEEAEE